MFDIRPIKGLFVADGRVDRIEIFDNSVVLDFVDAFEGQFKLHFSAIRSIHIGQCVGTSLLGFRTREENGEVVLVFFDDDEERIEITLSSNTSSILVEKAP